MMQPFIHPDCRPLCLVLALASLFSCSGNTTLGVNRAQTQSEAGPSASSTLNTASRAENWPQAAGPKNNWQYDSLYKTPVSWSVSRDENILWQTDLPNAGQSGIAIWQDKLFLTTFAPGEGHDLPTKERWSGTIQGHCVEKSTGKILWSVTLKGSVKSPIMYAFSDSTSPTPVTDGERVIFTNASGEMAAFDMEGKPLWRRYFQPWTPQDGFPFNKQHEPILYRDVVLHVEPLDDHRSEKHKNYFGWNFLRAINKYTGETQWIAQEASTTYTTSVMGKTQSGKAAVLTGRGGPHGVPEKPIGVSLISLEAEDAGKTIWRFSGHTDAKGRVLNQPGTVGYPTWQALYNMHWNESRTYLFNGLPKEKVVEVDTTTGQVTQAFQLSQQVDYRPWDPAKNQHALYQDVNLNLLKDWSPRVKASAASKKAQRFLQGAEPEEVGMYVFPAWHSNIQVGEYLYFLTGTAHFRNKTLTKQGLLAGPSHSVGRVNINTSKVEYLELPSSLSPSGEYRYGGALRSETTNSAGVDVAQDPRTKTDGWQIAAFWGSPTVINNRIYYTTLGGLTYVIDGAAAVLDAQALLSVNDLGEVGKTWSANSVSFSQGVLFHRSAKKLIAIKHK